MKIADTLPPGTLLSDGDFRIERLLGRGGFANTYLAIDVGLDREVAVKEFFPRDLARRAEDLSIHPMSEPQAKSFAWGLSRFVREAKTLARFKHPNIVRVFQIFDQFNTAYIVLEFVRGADMETWLKALGRRPSQDELDFIMALMLEALDLVHTAGILHRDVKPANIYIREDGMPVLLDFGAARFATASEHTGTTAAIVSRGYSPHEAYAKDSKLQGPWTDIYGLAATVYRALSGAAPTEATERVLDDSMTPASRLPLGEGLYRLSFLEAIDHGLEVLPSKRPQKVAEWRKALLGETYLASAGMRPSPGDSSYVTGVPSRTSGPSWRPLSGRPSGAQPSAGQPSSGQPSAGPSWTASAPAASAPPAVAPPVARQAPPKPRPTLVSWPALAGMLLMTGGAAALVATQPEAVRSFIDDLTGETLRRAEAKKAAEAAERSRQAALQASLDRAREQEERAAAARRTAEAEARRKQEEEARKEQERAAAERRRKVDAERQAALEAERIRGERERAEAEARRRAEEERQAALEADRIRKEQERAAAEAEARRRAEAERQAALDAERARREREAAEARRRTEEEERRKAEEQRREREARAAREPTWQALVPASGQGIATTIAVSGDGGRALVGTDRGMLVELDLRGGSQRNLPSSLGGRVVAIALEPGGKPLAALALTEGRLALWEGDTLRLIEPKPRPDGARRVAALALSRAGDEVMAVATRQMPDRTYRTAVERLRIADGTATGSFEVSLTGRPVTAAAFVAAREMLAAADVERGTTLWSLANKSALGQIPPTGGWVRALVFSADGQTLALAGQFNHVAVYDVTSPGKPALIRKLMLDSATTGIEATALAFSADGRRLAVGGGDVISIFDVGSGERLERFAGAAAAMRSIAFVQTSRGREALVLPWDDGTVQQKIVGQTD